MDKLPKKIHTASVAVVSFIMTVYVNASLSSIVCMVILKLAGLVAWSWLWISAPLWLPTLIFVVIYLFIHTVFPKPQPPKI